MRLSIYWITTCRAVRRLSLGLTLLSVVLFAFISRADDPVSAKIVSGDMFRIGDGFNCFRGIDAPELGQICPRANRRDFDYWHIAKTALVEHTAGGPVKCMPIGQNNYCIVADCRIDVFSLSQKVLQTGWAVTTTQKFNQFQYSAKHKRRGLWKERSRVMSAWRVRMQFERERRQK